MGGYKTVPEKIVTPTKSDVYRRFDTQINGRRMRFLIHRMVAILFIENKDNKPQVNHINGDKRDARACNLEWVTQSENSKHHFLSAPKKIRGKRGMEFIEQEGEEFKRIWDSDIFISNLGRICSNRNGCKKILTPHKSNNYLVKQIGVKRFLVHRMVAELFLDKKEGCNIVNHINGIKTDNRAVNLEWCTYKENAIHSVKIGLNKATGEQHPDSKYAKDQVLAVLMMNKEGHCAKDISCHTGVSVLVVKDILYGKSWSTVTGITYNPKEANITTDIEVVRQIKIMAHSGVRTKEISLNLGVSERLIRKIATGDRHANVLPELTIKKKINV